MRQRLALKTLLTLLPALLVNSLPNAVQFPLEGLYLGLKNTDLACQTMFPDSRVESMWARRVAERTITWKCAELAVSEVLPRGEVLVRGPFEATCEDDEMVKIWFEKSMRDASGDRNVAKGSCVSNEGEASWDSEPVNAGQTECVQGSTSSSSTEQIVSAWTSTAAGNQQSVKSAVLSIFSTYGHRAENIQASGVKSLKLIVDGSRTQYRACARALPGHGNIWLHSAVQPVF